LDALGITPLLISADHPERNKAFREKLKIPFPLLSDEDHAVADLFGIPIQRKIHPATKKYKDGFIQPAVFVYRGDREVFTFVQKPKMTNLWGAARRPTPAQVLDAVEASS
jgi:peroxiredoxin